MELTIVKDQNVDHWYEIDSDASNEDMFEYDQVQDDETLAKLEKEKQERSATLHTTGVVMALFAG